MRVIIDATSLVRKWTGIENYTNNLIVNLISHIDKSDELIILVRNKIPKSLKTDKKNIKIIMSPFKSQILTEQFWIPFVKKFYKPDVIHFPAFPPPFFLRKNIIFTVHDATMWKYPNTLSFKNKIYMKPLSKIGISKAEKILTVSESSKVELIDVFNNIEEKIVNTGISISNEFKSTGDKQLNAEVLDKYNINKKYFLTVGSIEPRKNLMFLIKCFAKFLIETNDKDIILVITGRGAWGAKEVVNFISEKNMESQIILTGYVPEEDLMSLYTQCEFFIFPSLYEGFGLPVLEAMACGSPVILANTSSLPEVAGDTGIYFNPHDPEELIKILKSVYRDKTIKENLSRNGHKRSLKFSWVDVVDKVYNEYKKYK